MKNNNMQLFRSCKRLFSVSTSINFTNRVVIVTGAESGIGRETAKLFSEHNAKVIGIGLNKAGLTSLQNEINCDIFSADCSNENQVSQYMQNIYDKYCRIDALCNIAGGFAGNPEIPFHKRSINEMNETFNNNFMSALINCHKVIPFMLKTMQESENNNNNGCSIINMASQLTEISIAGYTDYNASKYSIIGLTKGLCAEYGASNIRCNTIHPGPINTKSLRDKQDLNKLESNIPIGRIGEPLEIAKLFLWLASDHSLFVNGSKFVIDGGFSNQCQFYQSMSDYDSQQNLL